VQIVMFLLCGVAQQMIARGTEWSADQIAAVHIMLHETRDESAIIPRTAH
jgi:hypothetical protein